MKTYLGIDIGSTGIKVVELALKDKAYAINTVGYAPLASNIIRSESEQDQQTLEKKLKQLLKDIRISQKNAVVSLSESQVFTRIIQTPELTDKELSQSIRWEAEQYIPLPLDEVVMDYMVLDKDTVARTMEVLLVASPTELTAKYTKLFEAIGMEISALENESLPLQRVYASSSENIAVVDFGGLSTTIAVIKGKYILLVRSVSIGGSAMTKAIATEMGLAVQQADEYKKTYGLDIASQEGKISKALLPLVDRLVSDINQSITYFKERRPDEILSHIILTGGSAMMNGLAAYIQDKTQIKTIVGQPWKQITAPPEISTSFKGTEHFFSIATGLAMRGDDE